jgi:hypothetical protein
MKQTFYVDVKEVWSQTVEVQADTEQEAIEKVSDGEGNLLECSNCFQYDYTLNKKHWTISRKHDKNITLPKEPAEKYLL